MFLDDDDKFYSNSALSEINEKLKNINDIVFWKFKLSNKEIFPKNINKIKAGQIANSTYCFHLNLKI